MAVKPIIRKIGIIDANKDNAISVGWSGSRSYALRAIISDTTTNEPVLDFKTTTYYLSITIPAGTLENGKSYYVQVQSFDYKDTPSALSDKVGFHTLATPRFSFIDIPDVINTSSYTANVNYYSPDLENISSYTFYLYDTTKKQLMKSSTMYNRSDISYTYKGLSSDVDYYIRCVGITVNGLEVDTGYVYISVDIENPSEYAKLYASNVPDRGGVQLSTNLVIIEYNGDETFEYEDGRINLLDKKLYYDKGFSISKNFTLMLKGTHLWKNDELMTLKRQESSGKITLSSHIYSDRTLRFNLKASDGFSTYLIYSEPLKFIDEDEVLIAIRRIDDVYQIKTFVNTDAAIDGDYWWGTNIPTGADEMDQWIDTDESLKHYQKEDITYFYDMIEPSDAKLGDLWFSESDISSDITVEDISTTETLEKYLATYTLTSEYYEKLNLEQMEKYLKWFNSFITAVKARLSSELLETFYRWAEKQYTLINNWYLNNNSPDSLTAIIDDITENVGTILS